MIDVTFMDDGRVRLNKAINLTLPKGTPFTIEEGFVSDGGTIPRWAWPLLNLHPYKMPLLLAFIAHDAICDEAYAERNYSKRVFADSVLYYVARASGASWYQTTACYWAVRWYGRYTFWLKLRFSHEK